MFLMVEIAVSTSTQNTDHCSNCACRHQENCIALFTPSVVGDGFCNDKTNNADCSYHGGDCCVKINTDHRSNCTCHHQENCIAGITLSVVADVFFFFRAFFMYS